jgi:hypothetical protein
MTEHTVICTGPNTDMYIRWPVLSLYQTLMGFLLTYQLQTELHCRGPPPWFNPEDIREHCPVLSA